MHLHFFALLFFRCRQAAPPTILSAGLVIAALFASIVPVEKTHAQNQSNLSAVYGRGVHAFFANQSGQADMLFTQVIQAGSTDPRVFYFRAVARQQMGRQYEAENDMRMGAAYEARNPGSMGSISKALERVQGHARRKLEKFRREARLNRTMQQRHRSHARYENLQHRETQVLRKAVEVPFEQLLNPPTPIVAPTKKILSAPPSPIPTPAEAPVTFPEESPAEPPADQPLAPSPSPEEPIDLEDNLFGDLSEPSETVEESLYPPSESAELPAIDGPAIEVTDSEETDAEASGEDPFGFDSTPSESLPSEVAPSTEESDAIESSGEGDLSDDFFSTEDSDAEVAFPEVDESPVATVPATATDPALPAGSETPVVLAPSDRVKSDTLLGILGRVVGRTMPWNNIQLPDLGRPGLPAAEPPSEEFEFGPVDEPAAGEVEESPFEFSDSPPESSAAEETFSEEPTAEQTEPEAVLPEPEPEAAEPETTDLEEDPFDKDPFGGF